MSNVETSHYPQTFWEGIAPQFPDASPRCLRVTEKILLKLAPLCRPVPLKDLSQPTPFLLRGAVMKNLIFPSPIGPAVTRYFGALLKHEELASTKPEVASTPVMDALTELSHGMDLDLRFDLGDTSPSAVTSLLHQFMELSQTDNIVVTVHERQLRSAEDSSRPRHQWLVTIDDTSEPTLPIRLDLGELPRNSHEVVVDKRLGFRASNKSFRVVAGITPDSDSLKIDYPVSSLEAVGTGDSPMVLSGITAAALLKIVNSWALHGHEEGTSMALINSWEFAIEKMTDQVVKYDPGQVAEFIKQTILFMILEPDAFLVELGGYGFLQDTRLTVVLGLEQTDAQQLAQKFVDTLPPVTDGYATVATDVTTMLNFLKNEGLLGTHVTLAYFLNMLHPRADTMLSPSDNTDYYLIF